jgi:ABC-type multidrug transport system ATPase subunit
MTIGEELSLQHPLLHEQALAGDAVVILGAEDIAVQHSGLRLDLGLSHLSMLTPVHDLSTGERRRLSLIPMLMQEPDVLLLDEIDHGLDDLTLSDLFELLNAQRQAGRAVVISSHSPDLLTWARVSGGRVWHIADGTMLEVEA